MNCKISKAEFNEMKKFLKDGNILSNERIPYQVILKKNGDRVFYVDGKFRFFKNEDSFIRAAIKLFKTGG